MVVQGHVTTLANESLAKGTFQVEYGADTTLQCAQDGVLSKAWDIEWLPSAEVSANM